MAGYWKQGNQQSGYWKLELLNSTLLKFDAYLLKYESGAYVVRHVDPSPLEGHRHMRLNIIFKRPVWGGIFQSDGWHKKLFANRLIVFCSDEPHRVTECAGNRWVLSIGWLRKIKNAKGHE